MLEVGTKAHDFELPDQNGNMHNSQGIIVKANDKVKATDDAENTFKKLS